MATCSKNTKSNLNLSKNEINRIENALKDQEFVKLLGEYAQEIRDPENRKLYEQEISQIESDRGESVVFINPKPGYVLKTKNSTGSKVFINICSDEHVDKPSSKVERVSGAQGLQWSIPYSQSQPRQDIDKSGEKCMVYDVIFHPDTLYLAGKDVRLRDVVHSTALDAVEKSFDVQCERNNLKFPKMKFKGVFRPTVIRRPQNPGTASSEKPLSQPSMEDLLPEVAQVKVTKPEFSVKFRNAVDLQDHAIAPAGQVSSVRPKEMIINIKLPLLSSAAGVDLDVQEKSLCLVRDDPPKYNLFIDLQFPVDEEKGTARFDKTEKVLVVTLPIKPPPQMIAERLGSNDSGIEVDSGYRTSCDDVMMELSDPHSDTKENEGQAVNDDELRTESEESVASFLDQDKSYGMPSYLCSVQKDVIIFTIEVKNVSPDSFLKKVFSDRTAVSLKFSSLGAGFVPLHYAFAIDFPSALGGLDEEKMEVEFWDNNLVLQFPLGPDMKEYKVGTDISTLGDTLHPLQLPNLTTQKTKKRNKYQTEKHPKAMKTKTTTETEKDVKKTEKIRHCSGESTDSYMSESPVETIHLVEEDDDDDTDGMRTEDSCDEDLHLVGPPRFSRAISEESQICEKPKRGILKKRSFSMVGGRFRCYSESNMDDIGFSQSSDKLSLALSEATISEEEMYSVSATKKSVSFNEKVQQQYYRINSAIVANTAKNKKKAEKKKRALERRMSEGDAGSLEAVDNIGDKTKNMTTSSSFDLSELQAGWDEESHEDSGLSSSYEETILVTSDNSNQVNNNVKQKAKSKRMTKKRSKHIQMANELIFDLDI